VVTSTHRSPSAPGRR